MTKLPDTVSSKRGRERLRKHSDKLVSRTLKLLDKLYQAANQDDSSKDDIKAAVQAHLEIMPFIRARLSAIAPGELDDEGGISPNLARTIAERIQEQRLLLDNPSISEAVALEANTIQNPLDIIEDKTS